MTKILETMTSEEFKVFEEACEAWENTNQEEWEDASVFIQYYLSKK